MVEIIVALAQTALAFFHLATYQRARDVRVASLVVKILRPYSVLQSQEEKTTCMLKLWTVKVRKVNHVDAFTWSS